MGDSTITGDNNMITVVVIDDHEIITRGLQACLADEDALIHLVATGDRVATAWTRPGSDADVVVLDLTLCKNEPPVFGELRRLVDNGRRVVIHTADTDRSTAVRCITIGAVDYVNRDEGLQHLARAIRAAAHDDAYTPPWLSGAFLTDGNPNVHLARHEQDALRAWFASGSRTLAASRLNITQKTLDGYIQRVRAKYAAAGRPARTTAVLIRRALDDGVITYAELGSHHQTEAPSAD